MSKKWIRDPYPDNRDGKIVLCSHYNNFCEAVHPFKDCAIGVRDEMDVEDVHISNDIYLAIEGH